MRLIELPVEDRLMARAHALVRAMEPTRESEDRRRRVRRSLDASIMSRSRAWRAAVMSDVAGAGGAAVAAGSSVFSRLVAATTLVLSRGKR
jgi:hypothetical protein